MQPKRAVHKPREDAAIPTLPQRGAKEHDNIIGNRMRQVRLERKVTLPEVGRGIGVTHQQIAKYESGKNQMSLGRALQWCKFFDLHPMTLLQGLHESGKPIVITDQMAYCATPQGREMIYALTRLKSLTARRIVLTLVRNLVLEQK